MRRAAPGRRRRSARRESEGAAGAPGTGQRDALLHAAGKGANQAGGAIFQLDQVQHLVDAFSAGAAAHCGEELRVFAHREVIVERAGLRHVAKLRQMRLVTHRMAKHGCGAAAGLDEPHQHAHEGCLARPVWPEQAEDLTLIDVECQIFDGDDVAEALAELLCRYDSHEFSSFRTMVCGSLGRMLVPAVEHAVGENVDEVIDHVGVDIESRILAQDGFEEADGDEVGREKTEKGPRQHIRPDRLELAAARTQGHDACEEAHQVGDRFARQVCDVARLELQHINKEQGNDGAARLHRLQNAVRGAAQHVLRRCRLARHAQPRRARHRCWRRAGGCR